LGNTRLKWRPHILFTGIDPFLASDEAAFISGQYFVIDGGEIAGGLASQAQEKRSPVSLKQNSYELSPKCCLFSLDKVNNFDIYCLSR
jgi:hypothetical protein